MSRRGRGATPDRPEPSDEKRPLPAGSNGFRSPIGYEAGAGIAWLAGDVGIGYAWAGRESGAIRAMKPGGF